MPARSQDHEHHSCCQTQGHQNLDRPSPQPHSSARPLAAAPRLDAVASAAISALPRTRFVTSVKNRKLTSWTPTRRGVIDLFSGSRRYARACLRAGAEWVLPYDILDDAVGQNLLSPAVRAEVENLMRSGCFVGGGAGPVCSSFSKAITPPVRTQQHPEGISSVSEAMRQKIADGNSFAAWTAKVIRLATTLHLPLWIENPDGSWLWQQPCMQAILSTLTSVSPYGLLRVDYCRFGTPWRKRTRFLTTMPCVFDTCLFCAGCRAHTVLRGHAPNGVLWTRIAEPYPHALCTLLASALAVSAGLSLADAFDACRIADTARKRATRPTPMP